MNHFQDLEAKEVRKCWLRLQQQMQWQHLPQGSEALLDIDDMCAGADIVLVLCAGARSTSTKHQA